MDTDTGLETSALLQMLRDRGYRVTYASFMKWRQEGLIPHPLLDEHGRPERRGLGRGKGRIEARWPPAVLEQVEQICGHRQNGFRLDEIAVELWLSGFNIPIQRVREGLLEEWARFLGPFETQIYRLRQKLRGDDDSEHRAVDRLARRVARRSRPRFASLPRREQKTTVAAWHKMIALMVFGAETAEMQDGRRLTVALGFPEELAALLPGLQNTQWLRGALSESALAEVMRNPATAADLLVRVLPQARFLRFIAELPESLTGTPADWARTLRFMQRSLSLGPRTFWIGMLLMKMFRGGEDPEFSNVAATVEALVKEIHSQISRTSPLLAAQLMSAAQKIIPQVANSATIKKGR